MTEKLLGPTVVGDEISAELRRRKSKDIFQTVTASTKALIVEKVKLEEADGWRVVRKNSKSTRMAKKKPTDEQLEDEVWCLLAQMGFLELSNGRQFTIAVEKSLPPRQIDVFAKDEETVVIVECTQRDTPGRKSMDHLIEKIKSIKEIIHESIRSNYGRQNKLKVKYVIATRNIIWSDVDLAKCNEAKITVIADGELEYYVALVQHLKRAARYQFLSHLFGGQKIDGLAREVVATRGKMGGEIFYTFLISPDELMKIAYVGHKASRNVENIETYQRMLQPKRLKNIANYINEGGKFPTNIVVNFKTDKSYKIRFETKESFGNEDLGILYLPPFYAAAWIIDGQHRLYGYAYAREGEGFKSDETVLPVLAYDNLNPDKEMKLFIDINSEQVKVSNGLLVELYSDLHWKSNNPEEGFLALLSRATSRLNSERTSPLFDRLVVSGKKKNQHRCLTQTSIADGLKEAKLLGTVSKGAIVPGPLSTPNVSDYDANLKKALTVVSQCLRWFSESLPSHWKIGDGPTGYLCTNNGLRAIFHIIKDISDHVGHKEGLELLHLDADGTVKAIEPYLQVLVDYFKGASDQEIQNFRRVGSSLTAVRQQAWGMEAQIKLSLPDFRPVGLEEYLSSRDAAGTEEARTKVLRIQLRIFGYVTGVLRSHFGTQNKAWWVQGVPLRIRQDCTSRWEEKSRAGEEESQLFLQNYVDICLQNWTLFKEVISLDAPDKEAKTANTKWIRQLNEIRNKVAHPEQGVLDATQVAFVREIYDKVEKHFP